MRREAFSRQETVEIDPVEGQIDLSGLARALWRRRRWIVIPTILAGIAATVYVTLATPQYRSQALVLIENRETAYNRPEGSERANEPARPDPEAVASEVQLALSRDLARSVVRDLKLGERPEFNPALGASPVAAVLRLVGLARDPSRMTFEEQVLERFYERLSVYQVEKSRVIGVEFRSENPLLAAEVANAVAERLLQFQRAAKQQAMRQAGQWLAGEIEQLRGRVSEAEARAEEFRGKSNLYIGSNNNTLSAQQLGEVNSQIVLARTQRVEAESKAKMIREMLRAGRPIEASDVINSELIRRLNEQRVTLQAQLAEQSSTLLDQHPRIKELKAQIADLEAQTRAEAAKLARSLENDAKMIGSRVEALSASLDQVKKQASALGTEDVQMRALEREAKSQRDLLETYLARYRDVSARDGPDAVLPDARIVSQAVPAPTPYFPRKLPIVLIAMLATMVCAVTLVTLSELLSGDMQRRSNRIDGDMPTELAAESSPSWIGTAGPAVSEPMPSMQAEERRLAAIADHVQNLGRGLIVVTPAEAEGLASDVALELARELGQRGGRILLVNLEVGTNAISNLSADPRVPGFADLMFGVAHFGEVIQRDRASRVHIIPVGRGIRDTAALLAGERLAIILGALSQTYDHVIAAAPALTPSPAAGRLARFSRGVLVIAAEGRENAGTAASDNLAKQGFTNVAVVSVAPESVPPEGTTRRAAA
jgi:succinoglycan biosynthesis transport protein ExoP